MNLVCLPIIFLYIDFYLPILYILFMFVVIHISLNYFYKIFFYGFLSDYFYKYVLFKKYNFKYLDYFLDIILKNCFSFLFRLSYYRNIVSLYKGKYGYVLILLLVFILI